VHRRVVPLPSRPAVAEVRLDGDHLVVRSDAHLRDTAALVRRVRRWLDLDADPVTVGGALSADVALAPLVSARPGLRVPTTVDPWETLVRAVVGQQVSVAGATTLLGRIVAEHGADVAGMRAFPAPRALAAAGPDGVGGMPRSRARAVHAAAEAVASGAVDLADPDHDAVAAALLALPGIGPWTVGYLRLRGLADPDAFPASDLVLRQSAAALGLPDDPAGLERRSTAWSPWRAYAASHLWAAAPPTRRTSRTTHEETP
jgi:AraC family transcriptional regulator of adaptative response / DNA-3-methyladenine glycosylase II